MTAHHTFTKAAFPASFCLALLLALAMAACGNGARPGENAFCGGGWPYLDRAIEEAEALIDIDVLVPTYLPATTSSILESTINPPDNIIILFGACPERTSDILGPQVSIEETSQDIHLAEPGQSNPPSERVQILGTSALKVKGGSGQVAIFTVGWQQAGLSLIATFAWTDGDTSPPEITADMEKEALRVVESLIRQGE